MMTDVLEEKIQAVFLINNIMDDVKVDQYLMKKFFAGLFHFW